jgi:release factor glutamine methyltransferase
VIADLLAAATRRLAAAGIEAPGREARLLLAAASGLSASTILGWPERGIAAEAEAGFDALVARRAAREPLSRILGVREFWSLPFKVTPATLDPRADTETIVEAALAALPDRARAYRLLDLGTGTGCILLALLSELPASHGIGVDRSAAAIAVAAENAAALGLAARGAFVIGDWAAAISHGFDVIVTNPPYIRSGDIAGLAPEVRSHDPKAALDGGADGLDPYRILAPEIARLLAPGGIAALEIGDGQAADVMALLGGAGLTLAPPRADLAGRTRAVIARK